MSKLFHFTVGLLVAGALVINVLYAQPSTSSIEITEIEDPSTGDPLEEPSFIIPPGSPEWGSLDEQPRFFYSYRDAGGDECMRVWDTNVVEMTPCSSWIVKDHRRYLDLTAMTQSFAGDPEERAKLRARLRERNPPEVVKVEGEGQ